MDDSAPPRAATHPAGPDVLERLWPSWSLLPVVLIGGALVGLVVLRPAPAAAPAAFALTVAALGALLLAWAPTVGVHADHLVAGRARVPVRLLGRIDVLDAGGMRRAVGPDLDARSYLCLRGWVGTGLLVELLDPADPTPAWILSSRRPQRLADAIAAARR